MRTTFNKEFMTAKRGCYSKKKIAELYFSKGNLEISVNDILLSDIPLRDKYWFFCKRVFSKQQNQTIALIFLR